MHRLKGHRSSLLGGGVLLIEITATSFKTKPKERFRIASINSVF